MAQITSREELEEWLKDKPADWVQVIAMRVALRISPYESNQSNNINSIIALLRAEFTSWSACNSPSRKMVSAAYIAARWPPASGVARYAAYAVASTDPSSARDYTLAGAVDSKAVVYRDSISKNDTWKNLSHDCDWLASAGNSRSVSRRLTRESLWLEGTPYTWDYNLRIFADRLRAINNSFQVWIDWYNRRIEGHDAAFDIPGDTGRVEDKKILARLADVTNEDFWDKGATHVNTTLQSWIDEARERVKPSETPDEPTLPTPDAIRAVAAEIASPSVTLTNNKLDVIHNAAFDGQTDAANLDEAIAVLRAVVGALLKSLDKDLPGNGNIPYSFAVNLTIYDGELAKRDAKPFLGVLVRMEKSVSAGFHADPEMFDAGVTTNFESYFEAHLAFMTHYRRNEEREAKIAQFRIDDAAASGVALTGPVDEVVKEVDALAEQGLVTDGFVQAMKEQQAINDEVALYTSSVPTISGESTVKKRIILQTVGILERALAAVNNVVSATAQFGAFVKVVKQAIAELLKFFI